jgi:post-segregation antitoxin (ccd killing protein)
MQLYLPEELYRQVKARGLPASELLQQAVRAELRRQDLLIETDRHLASLIDDFGAPTLADRARARKLLGEPRRGRARKSA